MAEKKNRLRPTQLHFYVNDQELELIRTKMKQIGTDNLSGYLRKMAIDGYIIRLNTKELRELRYSICIYSLLFQILTSEYQYTDG